MISMGSEESWIMTATLSNLLIKCATAFVASAAGLAR